MKQEPGYLPTAMQEGSRVVGEWLQARASGLSPDWINAQHLEAAQGGRFFAPT
jgi:hypothetical protein